MATQAPSTSDTSPEPDPVARYPAISIVDLARRHRALHEYYEAVEQADIDHRTAHGELSPEPIPAGSELVVIRQRELTAVIDRVEDELRALMDLILATQPITLQDAAAQLLVAVDRADNVVDGGDDEDRQERWKPVRYALAGVVKIVAREAGLTLREISGHCFASRWIDPAPLLTELAVPMAQRGHSNLCADEPLPAEAGVRPLASLVST